MKLILLLALLATPLALTAGDAPATSKPPLVVGEPAPDFQIKDSTGKLIKLSELTAQGPVLVRLTCGCLGCDRELPYFQAVQRAYEGQGLTSLAVFKEPDAKVEAYVQAKKLNMLYAVDTAGAAWGVFQTKTMPSNFLIEKGGRIAAIATGCDTTGLIATKLSDKAATLTGSTPLDVAATVKAQQAAKAETK